MGSVYGVPKELKHYGCMPDLLERAGLIKEAMDMIEGMPMSSDVFVWGSLLGGCRHEFIAGDELHPQSDEIYSVLNSIGQQGRMYIDIKGSLRYGLVLRR
ncbi:putative tetratricopeptide-like helical domain superfamily [Helianthus debilis subsp. tardiflorus]